MAALDLGGGSTQVTFAAMTPASLQQKEYIHDALAPQGVIPVYTHSYLGLGLMAARKEIVTVGQAAKMNVISECVNPIIKNEKFAYGGVNYLVSGLPDGYPTIKVDGSSVNVGEIIPVVDFEKCATIIGKYVNSKVKAPAELTTKHINAFSYYYDRASEVGLIGKFYIDDKKLTPQFGLDFKTPYFPVLKKLFLKYSFTDCIIYIFYFYYKKIFCLYRIYERGKGSCATIQKCS